MKLPIYLDYASTTPLDERVLKEMIIHMKKNGNFGNSASDLHIFGLNAMKSVDLARIQIANLINADFREIIFTSGATESNNLAIKGIANFYKKNKHIITSKTEHKSVLNTCKYLEKIGFQVTYLSPENNGIINLKSIENAIRKNTILISIMHVNNETGIIQNIYEIGKLCHKNNILYHVDATQSVGYIAINVKKIKIDLMSFSAHKIYGPKGIGVLYATFNTKKILQTQIHGGGQEYNLRSGTLPVHQIVGIGKACDLIKSEMQKNNLHINFLKNFFWENIKNLREIHLNGEINFLAPHILNISFKNIKNISLIFRLKKLALSIGSTCSSQLKSSHVLNAMKIPDDISQGAIRFSFGKFTTYHEIQIAIKNIEKALF